MKRAQLSVDALKPVAGGRKSRQPRQRLVELDIAIPSRRPGRGIGSWWAGG